MNGVGRSDVVLASYTGTLFFKNIGTIIIYAVFGATVSTLLTGGNGRRV